MRNKDDRVDNSVSTGAGWVAIAVFLFATSADIASAFPPTTPDSTEGGWEAASIRTSCPALRCNRRTIEGKADNVADNNWWIKAVFGTISLYREEEEEGSARVEALSRDTSSKSLTIPLLAASMRQSVVSGTRPFHIAWLGGKPPFAAELIGPSGAAVASWQQLAERSVAATVSLEEGFYEVHITDASGQQVFGAFEVTSQRPTVDRRGVDQLPPELGAALLAARLADVDDGVWHLEAYERLTAAPSSDAMRIIANRLAHGLSVSELREQGDQLR
jgi:hypothetical protein